MSLEGEDIKSISLPDTQILRAHAQYFQSSAAPYEDYLSDLQKNAPKVAENWQGDATSAYIEQNQQLINVGYIHHTAQMRRASVIFAVTAARFDEGNELQRTAQAQLHAARIAEMAGNWLQVP